MSRLTELFTADQVAAAIEAIKSGPVHWLKNPGSDPSQLQTACKRYIWRSDRKELLDPNRAELNLVTCPECLAAMVDIPMIVKVT